MSDDIIRAEEGYGFTLTEFYGGDTRGVCYQITRDTDLVALTDWQMLQLVAAFVKRHNDRVLRGYAKKDPPRRL